MVWPIRGGGVGAVSGAGGAGAIGSSWVGSNMGLEVHGPHQIQNPRSELEELLSWPELPGHHRRLGWGGAPGEQDHVGWTCRETWV